MVNKINSPSSTNTPSSTNIPCPPPCPLLKETWWTRNKKWAKPVLMIHIIIWFTVMVLHDPICGCSNSGSIRYYVDWFIRIVFPEWMFFKSFFLLFKDKPHTICH